MAAELPRPGVEVIQVFQTVTPTVVTPTLVPCIVGVCRQVVDVLVQNSAGASVLNPQALVSLNAIAQAMDAVGTPPVYSGLDSLSLVVSLNNGPDITITFSGEPLTPAQVVAQVLMAFSDEGVTAFTAEVSPDGMSWRIRSYAANDFQTIKVVGTGLAASSPVVLAAFGFGADKVYTGSTYYDQHVTDITFASFPDPNANLSQLVVEPPSVRAFLFMGGTGGTLMELLQTEAFLRNGIGTAATVVGTVDVTTLTLPLDLGGKTLIFTFNGASSPLTVTFGAPANTAIALAEINAVIGAVATASYDATTNFLRITTLALGPESSIEVGAGTANLTVGLVAGTTYGVSGVRAIDSGNGTAVTPLLAFTGADFTASPGAGQIVGTIAVPGGGVPDGETLTLDDGDKPQTLTFSGASSPALVLTQINALFGAASEGRTVATLTGGGNLALTNITLGATSIMKVVSGTACATLGLTAGTTVRGNPFKPLPGDRVWVDGISYATVTQVAPGGNVSYLKIDKQVPISSNVGLAWYIEAQKLKASSATTGISRPYPNLVVDSGTGACRIVPEVVRDPRGNPSYPSRATLYLAYKAVRLDVSPRATNPGLLRFGDTTALASQLSPITVDNPLALGLYFALLNSPGVQVTALGVDSATPAAPYGTVEAYTRAATFLEGYEVYALAPLTHDTTVFQVFSTHVSVMSAPANKGERIVLINPEVPTHKLDTLVSSGANGNTTPTPDTFDTGVSNLGALLVAQGLTSSGPYATSAGIYLDIGDGKKYNIVNVVGSVVMLKTSGFLPGENDDGYYATSAFPTPLISDPFAVRIRGAALVLLDGSPDLEGTALTVQQMAQGYASRRVWSTFPDKAAATLQGIEQIVEGFYMNAAVAGMIGQQPPQQSFTNFPMTGFTRVIGSNDRFGERQLNVMAAGGNYVIVQDSTGTPLISRMALTTDMTSIETRTDSITKVVDFTAKFLRQGLKNFIGRFNITQGFLDSLGHVIQGLLGFLADSGVLIGSQLNNIVQDTTAPDTVLIDVTLDVPFPCNYIRLTLTI
jgi:hypothetical protein